MSESINQISALNNQITNTYKKLSKKWNNKMVVLIKDKRTGKWETRRGETCMDRALIKVKALFSPHKIVVGAEKRAGKELYLGAESLVKAMESRAIDLSAKDKPRFDEAMSTFCMDLFSSRDAVSVLRDIANPSQANNSLGDFGRISVSKLGVKRQGNKTVQEAVGEFHFRITKLRSNDYAVKKIKPEIAQAEEDVEVYNDYLLQLTPGTVQHMQFVEQEVGALLVEPKQRKPAEEHDILMLAKRYALKPDQFDADMERPVFALFGRKRNLRTLTEENVRGALAKKGLGSVDTQEKTPTEKKILRMIEARPFIKRIETVIEQTRKTFPEIIKLRDEAVKKEEADKALEERNSKAIKQ